MIDKKIRQPGLFYQLKNPIPSVLITCGQGDEALWYQACLGKSLGPEAYVAYFHETSLMLEKVRLFGTADVLITWPDGQKFSGCLKPHDTALPALVLQFLEWLPNDALFDQRICLIT